MGTSQSVTEGSQGLACVDLDAGASNQSCLWEVRAILGNSDITGCDDDLALSHRSCARPEMSRFRALCPVTCGCRDVWNADTGGPIEYDFNSIYIPRWLHGYMEGLLALLLRDSSFSERVWRQAQVFEAWLGTRAVWRPCGHHRQRNLGVDAWISAPS